MTGEGADRRARNFLHGDGTLRLARWATPVEQEGHEPLLRVGDGPLPTPMAGSPATGRALVSNGTLGIDQIRLAAGERFPPHTHPGDHLLIVVSGRGTVTYDGCVYPTEAGQVYLVEGSVAHAVGAVTDHVILAVGSPHRAVDAPDRQKAVGYQAVTAPLGTMSCLACGGRRTPDAATTLCDLGCPHCPCGRCATTPAPVRGAEG